MLEDHAKTLTLGYKGGFEKLTMASSSWLLLKEGGVFFFAALQRKNMATKSNESE